MDLNPKILKIEGKDELVVMTMVDYLRLREAAEDAQDVRAMRAARKSDRGKPDYSLDEARARLGLAKKKPTKKQPRVTRRKPG
ncbi:MAG: hypothetical protein JNK58_01855 [Phycisphaerae bacterium]|nr:hypothetical protein [Phycisphaerae bacterium]